LRSERPIAVKAVITIAGPAPRLAAAQRNPERATSKHLYRLGLLEMKLRFDRLSLAPPKAAASSCKSALHCHRVAAARVGGQG
jgi:hypothetical protein